MELSKEAKKARAAYMRDYMRKYRRNNPDKVKDAEARRWERKAAEIAALKEVEGNDE